MEEKEKPFQVKTQDRHEKKKWHNHSAHVAKIDAEREILGLCHEGRANVAIVVEMKPVVITRASRQDGVHMTYHETIFKDGYE